MNDTAQPQAVPQNHELKLHGDELEDALKPTPESHQSSTKPNAAYSGNDSKE